MGVFVKVVLAVIAKLVPLIALLAPDRVTGLVNDTSPAIEKLDRTVFPETLMFRN